MKQCFHLIEKKYQNYNGSDAEGKLLKKLVNGQILDNGYFQLENGTILNENTTFAVDDAYYQKLLDILR